MSQAILQIQISLSWAAADSCPVAQRAIEIKINFNPFQKKEYPPTTSLKKSPHMVTAH